MKESELSKLTQTLEKMSITPKQIISDLDYALDDILNALDRYNITAAKHIAELKEEGLTDVEETALSRTMTRIRNSVIVNYIDLL